MLELRHLTWMLLQWRRFRRLVVGATGAIWVICCSGILLLTDVDLVIRLALLAMLVLCTIVCLYLVIVARREIKRLQRQASELRSQELLDGQTQPNS